MQLGILHLSDIHIRSGHDLVLERVSKIVDAIKNLDPAILEWLVVITGDIAFSGNEAEYTAAYDLCASLEAGFSRDMGVAKPLRFVVIPGNHDLDLSGDGALRDLIMAGVKADLSKGRDASVRQLCTTPLANFFKFRDLFSSGYKAIDELRYEYRFSMQGYDISFQCYNSAWLSTLSESYGTLGFPAELFIQPEPADLVVTLFHHPYSWFNPDNARIFRKKVEQSADIILTGHEHEASKRTQSSDLGEVNQYIEGGSLQRSPAEETSAFNVIICDLAALRQRFFHFAYSDGMYERTDLSAPHWQPFQVNRLRTSRGFALRDEFASFLADPGVAIKHRVRGTVSLADVYVFPDLRQDDHIRDIHVTLRSDNLVDELLTRPRVVITGPEQCGKTSLAKRLFGRVHEMGFVPILLRGKDFRPRGADRMDREIEDAFAQQYEETRIEVYRQLGRDQKMIIIDDYDQIRRKELGDELLSQLCARASHVVLLADDLAHGLGAVVYGDAHEEVRFAHFKVQEFGELLRNRLILRWFQLGQDHGQSEEALAHRVTAVVNTVNAVIGTNFIPAYPIYVLSILQADEVATPFDLHASTHAYFYEQFIRAHLAEAGSATDYNIRASYLSNLAYRYFVGGVPSMAEADVRRLHDEFEMDRQLTLSFINTMRLFEDAKILDSTDGQYRFKYKYAYYYFVALSLSENLTRDTVRRDVQRMAEQLHVEEYANILLFLAHLARDPFIIEAILNSAKRAFAEELPEQLVDMPAPLRRLGGESVTIVYFEDDPWRVREELLKESDEMRGISERTARPDDPVPDAVELVDTLTPIARFSVAIKAIQILGQILKNFPGSLRGGEKEELLKECFETAERSIKGFFALLDSHEGKLVDGIVAVFRDTYPGKDDGWMTQRARRTVFGLSQLFCYGMIRRVSQAVGSQDLFETYRRVIGGEPVPTRLLFGASIHLDQLTEFPTEVVEATYAAVEKHLLASALLRQLVVHHLRVFPVPVPVRQRVTAKLGIEVRKALPPANPKDKLIK